MKHLTQEELNQLSRIERYEYYDELNRYDWSKKTLEEKDSEVRYTLDYFVGHRGISDLSLEEKFEMNHLLKGLTDSFTFFDDSSPFSQNYLCNFEATTLIIEGIQDNYEVKRKELLNNCFPYETQIYSSCLQFMLYHKAMIFLDRETAKKIMNTNNLEEIIFFSEHIKNYNYDVWAYLRSKIIYEGNKAKFEQNISLFKSLLDTNNSLLVYKNEDGILGTGFKEEIKPWNGKNLLGNILTYIKINIPLKTPISILSPEPLKLLSPSSSYKLPPEITQIEVSEEIKDKGQILTATLFSYYLENEQQVPYKVENIKIQLTSINKSKKLYTFENIEPFMVIFNEKAQHFPKNMKIIINQNNVKVAP